MKMHQQKDLLVAALNTLRVVMVCIALNVFVAVINGCQPPPIEFQFVQDGSYSLVRSLPLPENQGTLDIIGAGEFLFTNEDMYQLNVIVQVKPAAEGIDLEVRPHNLTASIEGGMFRPPDVVDRKVGFDAPNFKAILTYLFRKPRFAKSSNVNVHRKWIDIELELSGFVEIEGRPVHYETVKAVDYSAARFTNELHSR